MARYTGGQTATADSAEPSSPSDSTTAVAEPGEELAAPALNLGDAPAPSDMAPPAGEDLAPSPPTADAESASRESDAIQLLPSLGETLDGPGPVPGLDPSLIAPFAPPSALAAAEPEETAEPAEGSDGVVTEKKRGLFPFPLPSFGFGGNKPEKNAEEQSAADRIQRTPPLDALADGQEEFKVPDEDIEPAPANNQLGSGSPSPTDRSLLAPAPAPSPANAEPGELEQPIEASQSAANLVLFARRMVEMRVDENWFVTETAAGRDVRLVLSAQTYDDKLENGLWVSCHVIRGPEDRAAQEELLMERIAAITRQRATEVVTSGWKVDRWSGVRGEFRLEIQPVAVRGEAPQRSYRGLHALLTTPWALIEIHGVTPADDEASWNTLLQTVDSLRVREPQAWPRETTPRTADAEAALGVWKSSRGRLRLYDNGRVDIEADKVMLLSTPASRQEAEQLAKQGPPRLRGAYQATGDVLRITWEDGSRLNLRWKLSKGKLLVTDHHGKIAKLKPLLE
ncbi:MAG: hypothetical protein KDB14_22265 [Planctomycetales bacterium]|nr:hypothetical protein [Planctomycetales bacterium]